jgi:chromosome segregation ATPase
MAATVAAQIAALVESVNQLKERAEEDRDNLKEYHDKLSHDLTQDRRASEKYRNAVHDDLAKLTEGQKDILRRVEVIEPVASMVTSFRAKLVGAAVVLGFIGSVIIWALIYFKDQIHRAWLP